MSSNRRPWYPWYPKDFVVDEKVQSLSDDAELLYRRALDVMWQANALQLPNDCLKLANALARGWDSKRFENAWKEIQFTNFELFETTEDGMWVYSKRLKIEAEKIESINEVRRIAGKKGGKSNAKQKPSKRKANVKQTSSHTDTDTYPHTHTDNNKTPHTPQGVKDVLTKTQRDRFDIFYAAYPKKKSKGQAEKTFKKINPDEQLLASMIATIERAKTSDDWKRENGKFIPHPSSWLNARGWEDEFDQSCNPYSETTRQNIETGQRWLDKKLKEIENENSNGY